MQKSCLHCQAKFELSTQEAQFLEQQQIPEPKLCPVCRKQRRFAFRNERRLYKRKCDLYGEPSASTHRQGTQYKVFCTSCWWSDAWDGLDYGQEIDFTKNFLEQIQELKNKVPHYGVHNDLNSEDCKFINYGIQNKSSYLSVCTFSSHTFYCQDTHFSNFCIDSSQINNCKACCECTNCQDCYKVHYSQNCFKCHHSLFLDNCQNCQNCFLCTNQNHKEYMVMNQQLSKEQYEDYMAKIQLSYEMVEGCKQSLRNLRADIPKPNLYQTDCQNSTGNYLRNCKNCHNIFNSNTNLENCSNCDSCHSGSKDLHDCSFTGVNSNSCYECLDCTLSSNLKFSHSCRNCHHSEYCQYCSGQHLFGCIGLKNQEYCILNKKYTPEEYFYLKNRIIRHMTQEKSYGEFFPISLSAYPYNESLAFENFPTDKNTALKNQWPWQDKVELEHKPASLSIKGLIQEAPENLSQETLVCQNCQENYKIINREVKLRQQLEVPLNPYCLDYRYSERHTQLHPPFLYPRNCQNCQSEIQSSYSPDKTEIVYCPECYSKSLS